MRTFFDFTCPFCYLAQPVNKRLVASGITLTHLPFQPHPDIPPEGIYLGPRSGPMYTDLEGRAKAENLPLKWRNTLPNSKIALAAAEWVRRTHCESADEVRDSMFHAHFAEDRNIGDWKVVLEILEECGIDSKAAEVALKDGSAVQWVDQTNELGRSLGVRGVPSWENEEVVVSELREAEVVKLAQL